VLRAVAVGGVAAGLGSVFRPDRAVAALDQQGSGREDEHEHGEGGPLTGRRASATMSFGEWGVGTPLDRFAAPTASPNNRNVHLLLPREVGIEAGGSVNFIISGFHLVLIYDDGIVMGDIDTTRITPGSTPPGLIDDPNNRLYRQLDPRSLSYVPTAGYVPPPGTFNPALRDRVEVVQFPNPGRFFVACGVLPHFNEGMNGFVNVRRRED
jgi:hypothetical protein